MLACWNSLRYALTLPIYRKHSSSNNLSEIMCIYLCCWDVGWAGWDFFVFGIWASVSILGVGGGLYLEMRMKNCGLSK